jgi:multidrug efflux system membrane fusion protein
LVSAQATLQASDREFARVRRLLDQNNASIRAAQGAEAAAVRDRLAVQSARDRLAVSFGRTLAQRSDATTLVRALSLQERVLVRVDLPAGEGLAGPPQSARLIALADETRSMPAEFVGAAPGTDPQMQGQGFLFLTRDNSLQLAPEAAVLGYIALRGEPLRGVLVPRSALIRYAGQSWIYVQTAEAVFKRIPIPLTHAAEGGWLVSEGLKAGDRVVTDGVQLLLSEELKSQVSLGD